MAVDVRIGILGGVVPLCSAVVGDGGWFQVAVGRSTHLTSVGVTRKIKKMYMRGDGRCVLISIWAH